MKKFFTLIAAALMTLGANAQGTYAVGTGTPTNGQVVTDVPNITMTYGTGWDANKEEKKYPFSGFTYYTAGKENPEPAKGAVPTAGCFYKFEPAQDGTLEVGIVLNDGKAFYVLDADGAGVDYTASLLTYDDDRAEAPLTGNGGTTAKKANGLVKFDVKANGAYYVYCNGSKLGFCGFNYTTGEAGGDEPATPEVPYIFDEVETGVFGITMTNEDMAKAFSAYASWYGSYDYGVVFPVGAVMAENDNITIKAAVSTPVCYVNGKISDIKKETNYVAYINLGSTLGDNNWDLSNLIILDAGSCAVDNNGIISVTPKVDGVLGFGIYNTSNSREIGIWRLTTMEEQDNGDMGEFVAVNNFRHGTYGSVDEKTGLRNDWYYDNSTYDKKTEQWVYEENPDGVKGAPAYVKGDVKAGKTYLLIGGGSKTNLNLHEITFKAGETSISSAIKDNAVENNVMYNLAGQRIAAPVSGQIYIVNGKKYIAK